jgi:hypothetical protein
MPSQLPEANAQPPSLLREVCDSDPPDELEIERVADTGLKRDQASEEEDREQRADREPWRACCADDESGEEDDPTVLERAEQAGDSVPQQAR